MDFEKNNLENQIEGAEAEEIKKIEGLLEGNVEMNQEEIEQMKQEYENLTSKIEEIKEADISSESKTMHLAVLSAASMILGGILTAAGVDAGGTLLAGGFIGLGGSIPLGEIAGLGGSFVKEGVNKAKVALLGLKQGKLQQKLATVGA